MKRNRGFIYAIGLSIVLAVAANMQAYAQDKSQDISDADIKAAQKIVEAEKADAAAYAVVGALSRDVARLFIANNPDLEEPIQKTAEEVAKNFIKEKKSAFTDVVVRLYAKRFTSEELASIAQFYETEVGKKYAAEQAKLSAEILQESTNWGDQMVETIVAAFRKAMADKGYKL